MVSESGKDIVNEDDYNFVAFDAVVLPAVRSAKPSLREGLDRDTKVLSLKESLLKEVSAATTQSELNLIKSVVEATNLPDTDSILESVSNKSQELSKGTTSSSGNLLEDLEKANDTINNLKKENRLLKSELTTSKSRISKHIASRQRLVKESKSLQAEYDELIGKYNDLSYKSSDMSRSISLLEESLNDSRETIEGLNNKVRATGSDNKKYELRISNLEESLRKSQELSKVKSSEVSKLESKLEELKHKSLKSLNESKSHQDNLVSKLTKLEESVKKSNDKYYKLIREYATDKCISSGLNLKLVLESITPDSTKSEVDNLIKNYQDQRDRYRSLPFSKDVLLSSLDRGTIKFNDNVPQVESEEDRRTDSFMDNFFNKH